MSAESDSIDDLLKRVAATDSAPRYTNVPARAGRYVVRAALGRGGLGLVHTGWDPELDREVAIKFVRPDRTGGVAGERMQRRLRREARALARLTHPNVVPVFDVGEAEGQVWLVMKKLDGPTLRQWLRRPRSLLEIAAIFAEAGEGLAAAHEVGILHRDFKPDNVLVVDDHPIVVDFGLAGTVDDDEPIRGVEPSLASSVDGRTLTDDGAMVGTRAYAAPEQLAGTATAHSDQYAFCVALHEAAFGYRPGEGADRRVLDTDIARRIATIVDRGLDPHVDKRWPSMRTMLQELALARRVRRRRWLVVAALVSGVALWFASTTTEKCPPAGELWSEDQRARLDRAIAASDASEASTVARDLERAIDRRVEAWTAQWNDACPAGAPPPASWIGARACLQARREELAAMLDALERTPEPSVLHMMPLAIATLTPASRCRDPRIAARHAGEPPTAAALWRSLWRARALVATGADEEAAAIASTVQEGAAADGRRAIQADVLVTVALLAARRGDVPAAERDLQAAYELAIVDDEDDIALSAAVALAHLLSQAGGRPSGAMEWARIARSIAGRLELAGEIGEFSVLAATGDAEASVGQLNTAESSYREALAILERHVGAHDVHIASVAGDLAIVLRQLGRADEALVEQQRSYEILRDTLGPDTRETVRAEHGLAVMHFDRRAYAEAEALYRDALRRASPLFGADHPVVMQLRERVGTAVVMAGRVEEGLALQLDALRGLERLAGPEHIEVARMLGNLQGSYLALDRFDDAEAAVARAESILATQLGPEHPDALRMQRYRALIDLDRGRAAKARDALLLAAEVYERTLGAEAPELGFTLVVLGRAQLDLEEYAASERTFTRALEILAKPGLEQARSLVGRSRARRGSGQVALAIEDAERAVALCGAGGPDASLLGEASLALGEARVAADRERVASHRDGPSPLRGP